MKTEIMTKASRLVGRAGLQIKKHSPEIFMVGGIIGTIASTVIACKATTKADDILKTAKEKLDIIHKGMDEGQINGNEYPVETSKNDLKIVYIQTGVKVLQTYAPAIALGTVSIASIVWGQQILKKRNIALAAAYAVMDNSFKEYRKNVVERFGESIDKELRYGVKAQEVETVKIDENGNEVVEKEIVNVPSLNASPYARFFEESSRNWSKEPGYNLMFLRKQQDYANDVLKCRGHLFLNEVYDMLDIPRTPDGQIVGWIYDPNKNPVGDNYVDFGIYDVTDPNKRAFVNGIERNILLDFNVDGSIYNKIGRYQK